MNVDLLPCVYVANASLIISGGKTVDLKIHLDSCDTLMSTGYLEVHVAVEVFKALNVYHRHPSVALGDKTAGNTGYRRLYRHACCPSGTSVEPHTEACDVEPFEERTSDTSRIAYGNSSTRREYGNQSTLCQRAVTDLTSAGASASLCFAYRVCREYYSGAYNALSLPRQMPSSFWLSLTGPRGR